VLAVGLDTLEHIAHFLGRVAVNAVENKLGIAEDGVERRAQFMAHIGEELRLVFARFLDLATLFLNFLEQAHVLDGDDGLVGEGVGEFDLLIGERPHRAAAQNDDTNRIAFAQQRHTENGVETSPPNDFLHRVFGIGLDVGDMDRLSLQQNAPSHSSTIRFDRTILHTFTELARNAMAGDMKEAQALGTANRRHICIAQAGDRLHERAENGLQIEGRAADDLQHLRCRGLLLERFRKLVRTLLPPDRRRSKAAQCAFARMAAPPSGAPRLCRGRDLRAPKARREWCDG
jgi:hypothetical protein